MALSPEDKQDIAKLFLHMQGIPANQHSEDHQWVQRNRTQEKESAAELKELKRRVLRSACIWAIPFIIGFLFTAIYHEAISMVGKAITNIISSSNR